MRTKEEKRKIALENLIGNIAHEKEAWARIKKQMQDDVDSVYNATVQKIKLSGRDCTKKELDELREKTLELVADSYGYARRIHWIEEKIKRLEQEEVSLKKSLNLE